tara:strand:+ start:15693 stop:15947 length:255 start_codon:yes stop_codon:yes gene_type:complete
MGFVPTAKVTQQAIKGIVVVPDNDNDLTTGGAVLFIGTGGDVKVDTVSGDTLVFKNLGDGSILPVQVRRVYATGTAAQDMIALY